jgi:hypothetical protein
LNEILFEKWFPEQITIDLFDGILGTVSFRMCYTHSLDKECIQSFLEGNKGFHRDLIAKSKSENTKEEEKCWFTPLSHNKWRCLTVLDHFYGADRLLFKTSVTQEELLGFSSSVKKLIGFRGKAAKGKVKKIVALREPFSEKQVEPGSVPPEALEWRQYMNNLCKVYKASIDTTTSFKQWASIEEINKFLLKKVGFHRGDPKMTEGLKMTEVTSYRKHNEESTKAHIDHPAFCWDYLLGWVLSGSYRLAFILNPCEVMLGQKPKFDFVKLKEGDVYCITGPQLELPHLPIPAKGTKDLKREVLLIGGLFCYREDAIIGRRFFKKQEDLMELGLQGTFYHYRLKDLTTEEVISGLKKNQDFLYDNRTKLLDHKIPDNAVDGNYVIGIIDQLESLEVNSSITLYLPFLVITTISIIVFSSYYYYYY